MADVRKKLFSDLIDLVKSNNVEAVRDFLLEPSNYTSEEVDEAFFVACDSGNTEIVKLFLKHPKVNFNQLQRGHYEKDLKSPFFRACENGNDEVVRLLLADPRIDVTIPDQQNQTPFYVLCETGNYELIEFVLQDPRININQANIYGHTPLHLACSNNNLALVQLLLNSRATMQADQKGNTPLHNAIEGD